MLTIYGDTRSGNCFKVKTLCDHLGLEYQWIDVSLHKSETRTQAFLSLNPAGQIPVVTFEDDTALAQSNAILLHLARDTELVPRDDPFAYAKVLEWLFWEQYSHEPNIAVVRFQRLYLGKPLDQVDQDRFEAGNGALDLMDRHLGGRDWFAGADVTIADLALVAYTRVAHEGGFDLGPRRHVADWIERVEKVFGVST